VLPQFWTTLAKDTGHTKLQVRQMCEAFERRWRPTHGEDRRALEESFLLQPSEQQSTSHKQAAAHHRSHRPVYVGCENGFALSDNPDEHGHHGRHGVLSVKGAVSRCRHPPLTARGTPLRLELKAVAGGKNMALPLSTRLHTCNECGRKGTISALKTKHLTAFSGGEMNLKCNARPPDVRSHTSADYARSIRLTVKTGPLLTITRDATFGVMAVLKTIYAQDVVSDVGMLHHRIPVAPMVFDDDGEPKGLVLGYRASGRAHLAVLDATARQTQEIAFNGHLQHVKWDLNGRALIVTQSGEPRMSGVQRFYFCILEVINGALHVTVVFRRKMWTPHLALRLARDCSGTAAVSPHVGLGHLTAFTSFLKLVRPSFFEVGPSVLG
jgi:hypothetical protein